jgi:signal transduction histidine kinase/ligand-binding sensor domain-containing protein
VSTLSPVPVLSHAARRTRLPYCPLAKSLTLCLIASLPCGVVSAQEPEVTLDQLNHRAYGLLEGAPSYTLDIAQTTDGSLWLASAEGLSRFDGARFTKYPGPSDEPLPTTLVYALLASPDGGLWMGFGFGGVGFLKAGHLTAYTEKDGVPGGSVHQLLLDHDGTLWIATTGGLGRLRGGHCERVASDLIDRARSLALDKTGALWVQTGDRVFVRAAGQSEFREMGGFDAAENPVTENQRARSTRLAVAPDGSVWAAFPDALLIFAGSQAQSAAITRLKGWYSPLMFDREGNLWARKALTLHRWENSRLISERATTLADIQKQNEPRDSPSAYHVNFLQPARHQPTALFEDREGNVWVGRSTGVDRYSRSTVRPVSLSPCAGPANTLSVDEAGTFWSGCPRSIDPTSYVLMKIQNGVVVTQYETKQWFSAGYRARDGTVWFGSDVELAHLVGNRLLETPIPPAARGIDTQAISEDRDGSLWVSVVRKGVFHVVASGEWVPGGGLEVLKRLGPAVVEVTDADGNIWFGYPNNRVARLQSHSVRVFDGSQGLSIGGVESIYASGRQIWAGGELGLARLDGARFISILSAAGTRLTGLSGIVATHDGDLWLNGTEGITRIPHAEIEHVIHDPRYHVQSKTFDVMDGVPGSALQIRTIPSALNTGNGQLWFEMTDGLVLIDSQHLILNTLPPPVTIWSLRSNDKQYPNQGSELRLPVHSTNADFNYSAGSLTVPEHVRFRYKLEGSDRDWQDGGNRRDARYTNLGPGHYTFRVTASNNDGAWNTVGASLRFEILPAFYQSPWFYALCALAGVALLSGLYRVRMRQVAGQVRGRLEARLAERERIARELHDTLLQGMQGLIWRFQAAADRIPPGEPARRLMEQSLDRADKLLGEGRDRVKDLRPRAGDVVDLVQALAAEGEQFAQLQPAKFRVSVQGTRRDLHPIVCEEGFLIAREALGNAFQHAGANNIEAEVSYGQAALQVRIRDDGRGISAAVLDAGGSPGHFGLIGMRERAKKLGGQLDVWSRPGAGTEIDLRVPADVAYRRSHAGSGRARPRLRSSRSTTRSH